jgi:hypothetical protein
MSEQETLVARVLCEVLDVDTANNRVRVQIRGKDAWIAERSFDLDFCPELARIAGGSFYAETYRKESGEEELRSAQVDAEEERAILDELFKDIPDEIPSRDST